MQPWKVGSVGGVNKIQIPDRTEPAFHSRLCRTCLVQSHSCANACHSNLSLFQSFQLLNIILYYNHNNVATEIKELPKSVQNNSAKVPTTHRFNGQLHIVYMALLQLHFTQNALATAFSHFLVRIKTTLLSRCTVCNYTHTIILVLF